MTTFLFPLLAGALTLGCGGDDAGAEEGGGGGDDAIRAEPGGSDGQGLREGGRDGPAGPLIDFGGKKPKNVLMISIDTLRRDRVGRYGKNGNTPFMDRLLGEGVALDNHRSCSDWTYPSILCALTGVDSV